MRSSTTVAPHAVLWARTHPSCCPSPPPTRTHGLSRLGTRDSTTSTATLRSSRPTSLRGSRTYKLPAHRDMQQQQTAPGRPLWSRPTNIAYPGRCPPTPTLNLTRTARDAGHLSALRRTAFSASTASIWTGRAPRSQPRRSSRQLHREWGARRPDQLWPERHRTRQGV